jgi:hypothetical protein
MPPRKKAKKNLFEIETSVVEEINFGDTKLRLVETAKGKQSIKLWSSLSKQWNTMYRYDVEENWLKWKKLCQRIRSKTQ